MNHPLANRDGLTAFFAILFHAGCMCPKCGWATRATSARWGACKNAACGERRIPRTSIERAGDDLFYGGVPCVSARFDAVLM